MHHPTVKSLYSLPWSPDSATTSFSTALTRQMCCCFRGLMVLSFKIYIFINMRGLVWKWEVMLNVFGVSLSVLSHFLPLQCAAPIFSPCFILGSDWRCMADYCLVFRKGGDGRSAMACSFSRLCLTGCEMHPEWWNERQHSSVHDGCSHCSWYALVHFRW